MGQVSLLPVPGHTTGPQAATVSFQMENSDNTTSDPGVQPSSPHTAVMFATTRPTNQSGESDEAGVTLFSINVIIMFILKIMPFMGFAWTYKTLHVASIDNLFLLLSLCSNIVFFFKSMNAM